MKITSGYGMEILHQNKIFLPTAKIYQSALKFCITIFNDEWDTLGKLNSVYRKSYAEHLIHTTKKNTAKYPEFDRKFYKLPMYLLRDVVATSLGQVSAYQSNIANWEKNGCEGNRPTLQKNLRMFPTFYKGNMSDSSDIDNDIIRIKLYVDNDWKYVPIKLKHTDMEYLRKHFVDKKISNPTLGKKYDKWFLWFAITEEQQLHTKDIKDQKILAVDLGINTDATCSVMTIDGTILGRKFINFPSDKDRIWHCLNRIKGIQQKYGHKGGNTKKEWRYCTSLNTELARKIAKAISEYAMIMQVDTIVFEKLDISTKVRKSSRQKLSLWKKNTIQNLVEHKAHRYGMRITHTCAWGTSRLAYDGSGAVSRGVNAGFPTHAICRFSSGKIYNCDLSASYNIGARYFIRELQKSTSVTKWSDIMAKVPECQKRSQCTYSTLLKVIDNVL